MANNWMENFYKAINPGEDKEGFEQLKGETKEEYRERLRAIHEKTKAEAESFRTEKENIKLAVQLGIIPAEDAMHALDARLKQAEVDHEMNKRGARRVNSDWASYRDHNGVYYDENGNSLEEQ